MLTDHDLQAELAAAFREQAGPASGAALDATGIFRRAERRRRRRRVAVRTAALVTVAAVTVVAVTVASHPARPGPGLAARPPGLLLDAALVSPPSAAAAVSGMPRYYVTADHIRPVAEVRSAATGRLLSVVALPHGIDPKLSSVAAAGDGRTFALALSSFPQTRFYLLRIAPGGGSARLTALRVPPLRHGIADGISVSPDGTRLAVAIQFTGGQHGAMEVASLTTGAVTTWTTIQPGIPSAPSWADRGRELGFFWQGTGAGSGSPGGGTSGLWVLDTTAPGRNLLSGRRIVPDAVGGDTIQSAQLAPDGTTAIAAVTYDGTTRVSRGTVVGGIVELSARTGRPLRTLLAQHAAYSADPGQAGWYIGSCLLAAVDASGGHLLVSCDRFGRLDHGRFTALPGVPPQTALAAAW